jgi:hypothetical protein
MKKKYNFECLEGRFINPNTLKPFKVRDEYNGLLYHGITKGKNTIRPNFRSKKFFQDEDNRARLNRSRDYKNPYLKNHIARELLNSAKSRVKKRGAKVTITKEWILNRLKLGRCELTGICFELDLPNSAKSPSLDRKNNLIRDYTPENTMLVLNQVNMCRNQWPDNESAAIFKKLSLKISRQRRNSI